MRIKGLLLGFAALAAAIALAACGGGSSSTGSSTAAGGSTVASGNGPNAASAPDIEDWPVFGRDRDNTRFATQDEIDTDNVDELGEAWSTGLGPDQYLMESFPLVIGDNVYVTTSTDEVMQIDGKTGHINWTYTPEVDFSQSTGVGGYGITVNRGVAAEDGKLFVLTFDNKLQAISEKTGERLWSSQVEDPATGAYESMAPTAYDGKVFVGVSGSEDGVRGKISAYDANTGKKLWTFYTVPKAGTKWVPKGGGGGTIYMPPTVDAATGTVYVGTGNPAPVLVGAKRPGKNLYTDSILALDADTGKLKWYHQEQAHDLWDYDAESPVVLFDVEINGEKKRGLAEAGKNGLLFLLDAETGEDLFPPVGFVKRDHKPPTTKPTLECPGAVGGSQYSPLAYSPETQAVYVSGINLCMYLRVTYENHNGEKQFAGDRVVPKDTEKTGTFTAVGVNTGKIIWKHDMPTPMDGGATASAGGLVFTGDQQGVLYAFDAANGDDLWQADLKLAFGTAPVIYSIDGTEYVLATVGGAALTASEELGEIGARVIAFKLGGKKLPTGPELKG
ncbi:MAG TPA: PQQ-binding-like beta-propeller repeat protein [Solirubrobacterales bacterium]|nr:PQQ-binding-like beta-propeller repeat protein [Solirubrobacterales bacterium]